MKNLKVLSLSLLAGSLFFTSCNSDDDNTPEHIHDHEAIHEMIVTRTDADGSNPVDYVFDVEENKVVGDMMTLENNKTYHLEITGLMAHEENGEEHNLLDEIIEEKDEHFFVYTTDIAGNFERMDDATTTRTDGNKMGVKVQVTPTEVKSGKLNIVLKHKPQSVDDDANGGLGSATLGSSDIDVTYPVVIK